MERTSKILIELQSELQKRMNQIQDGKVPESDWSVWFEKVDELQSHLAGQLENAAPRFAQASLGASATARHSEILDSINSFKAQI